jgi:predicted Zn-dependent protease
MALISEKQEILIGKEAFRTATQAQGGAFNADPELAKYVSEVGMRVAKESARPDLPYEFIIVNDSTPNAWTLPGGKIAINRGLLTELHSEAELAAVLGHEIVHADARHGAKSIERGLLLQGGIVALGIAVKDNAYNDVLVGGASVAAMLVASKYSRNQELESDRYGMIYMTKAGYNPEAAVSLQETFLKLSEGKESSWLDGLFASHPPSQERITANRTTVLELAGKENLIDGKTEYQGHLAKLISNKEAYDKLEEGQKALARKDYDLANKLADEAILQYDGEALFWLLKGEANLAKRNAKEAMMALNHAEICNDDYYAIHLKRAEAKTQLGDFRGAKKEASKSLTLLPTGEGHELMGRITLKTGNKRLAMQHFRMAAYAQSPAGERARAMLEKLQKE